MQYKSRSGYTVTVNGGVSLSKSNKKITFKRSDISEVMLTNSAYDLPFFESTVIIRLQNGKKHKIKRLPRGQAKQLFNELN